MRRSVEVIPSVIKIQELMVNSVINEWLPSKGAIRCSMLYMHKGKAIKSTMLSKLIALCTKWVILGLLRANSGAKRGIDFLKPKSSHNSAK